MAEISKLSFDKSWTSKSDFPSVEPDETQARADMQYLHDRVKDYINNTLVPAIQNGEITNVAVDATGQLTLTYKDGKTVECGIFQNYKVVESVSVNSSKQLVIYFTDGKEQNLGAVGGDVDLTPYAKKTDLSSYVKKTDLSSDVTSTSTTTAANSYAVWQVNNTAAQALTQAQGAVKNSELGNKVGISYVHYLSGYCPGESESVVVDFDVGDHRYEIVGMDVLVDLYDKGWRSVPISIFADTDYVFGLVATVSRRADIGNSTYRFELGNETRGDFSRYPYRAILRFLALGT